MSIIHSNARPAHAIAMRKVNRKATSDEDRINDKKIIMGQRVDICTNQNLDSLSLVVEGEDMAIVIPIDRRDIKRLKTQYEWFWRTLRHPKEWGRHTVSGKD